MTKSITYIQETKKRITYIFFSFFFTFFLCYCKWYQLAYIFLLSFSNNQEFQRNFIFTDVSSAFSSTIWICLGSSFLLILPFIIYQFFCFFSPSWYYKDRRTYRFSITIIMISWYFYIFLVNLYIIPELCAFLLEFQVNTSCLNINVQPKIDTYLSWASSISLLATFFFSAFLFYIIMELKWINYFNWQKQRKNYFFFSLFFSALISPPDIVNQITLTSIIFIFIEFLVWFSLIRKRLTII